MQKTNKQTNKKTTKQNETKTKQKQKQLQQILTFLNEKWEHTFKLLRPCKWHITLAGKDYNYLFQ